LTNWIIKLTRFEFDAFHLKGTLNVLPDLMSRINSERSMTETPIPSEEVIEKIIGEAHSQGHFGANIMCKHITITKQITNIPNLFRRCLKVCKQCDVCRLINNYRVGYSPVSVPRTILPGEYIHCDLFSMRKSRRGLKYVIVMVDDFSRFIWMKAISSKTKEEAVKNMLDVFTTFGFPRDFKTDNGGEFENELAFAIEKAAGVSHKFVLPSNHHANGLVEIQNRTARNTILKLCLEATKDTYDWDLFVGQAMLHINSRIHPNTKSTPFALMFGRNPYFKAKKNPK